MEDYAVTALKMAFESLTLVVAEGCDRCDPEGIAAAIGAITEALEQLCEQ